MWEYESNKISVALGAHTALLMCLEIYSMRGVLEGKDKFDDVFGEVRDDLQQ